MEKEKKEMSRAMAIIILAAIVAILVIVGVYLFGYKNMNGQDNNLQNQNIVKT